MAEKVFTRNYVWDEKSFLSVSGADQVLWLKRLALWFVYYQDNGKKYKYYYIKKQVTANKYIQNFYLALTSFREVKKNLK